MFASVDVATVAVVTALLAFGGTIYAAVTGYRTASRTVAREDWVASREQDRKDREELRQVNDDLRADNAELVRTNRQLVATTNRQQGDLEELRLEIADLRNGLARALEHVTNCEAELAALKGSS